MSENLKLPALKSFYSLLHGGLVTLEDDVLGIVRQVREDYGDRVAVELDPDTGWYHFVEYCEDSTIRLIFSVERLDSEDVLDRLRRADSQRRGYVDPYDAAEREQDALQAEADERAREKIRESGEMLAHVLKKQGIMPRLPLTVNVPKEIPGA